MNSETKRCPYCDEEIRAMALKCRHCGSILDDASDTTDIQRGAKIKIRAAEHKERAEAYKRDEDYARAYAEITSALEFDPTNSLYHEFQKEVDTLIQDKHLANAEAFKKEYKFEEAVFEYHAILDRNPKNLTAQTCLHEARDVLERLSKHVQKGDALRKIKKHREAIEEFEHALKINPHHKYARSEAKQCRLICDEHDLMSAKVSHDLEAAESEYEHKKYGKAISDAQEVLERIPDHAEALALIERSRRERFRNRKNILILIMILLAGGIYFYAMEVVWDYAEYRSVLKDARAAAEGMRLEEAIGHCYTALEYRPNSEEAGNLLLFCIGKGDQLVRKAEQQALWAKEQAKKTKAKRYAKQEYAQAQEAEALADSHYLSRVYALAQTYYVKAFEMYKAAEKKAAMEQERLEKLGHEQKALNSEREEIRMRAISSMKAADNELAGHYPIESYSLAQGKMDAGREAQEKGDHALAVQYYEQAAHLFSQSAKEARDGVFLPEGLEKREGEIVSAIDDGEMAFVPAGRYNAGSRNGEGASNEYPRHRVKLHAFYMDKYEVTAGQYRKFIRETGHNSPSSLAVDDSSKDTYPVTGVTREDAVAYAEWAGKRLPTEAEWEYACRAGTTTKFCFGNSMDHDRANYSGIKGEDQWTGVAPVGSFKPNAWGLFDMHGNVSEWCQDWYDRNCYRNRPSTNPMGPAEGVQAVIRGGSCKESAYSLRSAARGFFPSAGSRDDLGFRCVK